MKKKRPQVKRRRGEAIELREELRRVRGLYKRASFERESYRVEMTEHREAARDWRERFDKLLTACAMDLVEIPGIVKKQTRRR